MASRKKADLVKKVEESLATAPLPWERQHLDTDTSWEFFVRYRDMPRPRAFTRLQGARPQQVSEWYKLCDWRIRIEAYDRYLDNLRRDEIEAALVQDARATAVEHMGILRDARELLTLEIGKLLKASQESEMPGLIRPAELTKMMETVMKFDRLLNNQSTSNVEHVITDLTGLTDEELTTLEELQRKIHGGENK